MAAAKSAKEKDGGDSPEMQRCKTTLALLGMAIEVQRGALAVTKQHDDGVALVWLTVTLGEKAPETKALIVNGDLFISALDAGGATVRERSRLLAVARRTKDA